MGLVFRIAEGTLEFDPNIYTKLPKTFREGSLYLEAIQELAQRMKSEGKEYVGGKNLLATVNLPNRTSDKSFVHVAFDKEDDRHIFKENGDWVALFCPMGNIKRRPKRPKIMTAFPELPVDFHYSLYEDDNPEISEGLFLDKKIMELLASKRKFNSVEEILSVAKQEAVRMPLAAALESGHLPSRTSLTLALEEKKLVPTMDQLGEIFAPSSI